MTSRQPVKVPTYSTNRGLSKNAIKKVVILIGSKDKVFAKSLWWTCQVYNTSPCWSVCAIFVTVRAIIVTFHDLSSQYDILSALPFLFSHSYCLVCSILSYPASLPSFLKISKAPLQSHYYLAPPIVSLQQYLTLKNSSHGWRMSAPTALVYHQMSAWGPHPTCQGINVQRSSVLGMIFLQGRY